jgi:hypothetical protein
MYPYMYHVIEYRVSPTQKSAVEAEPIEVFQGDYCSPLPRVVIWLATGVPHPRSGPTVATLIASTRAVNMEPPANTMRGVSVNHIRLRLVTLIERGRFSSMSAT